MDLLLKDAIISNNFGAIKKINKLVLSVQIGKYWFIQNNIIRFANSIGIDWGNEGKSSQDLEIGLMEKLEVHIKILSVILF